MWAAAPLSGSFEMSVAFSLNASSTSLLIQAVRIPVLTYAGENSYFIGVTAARETLKRFTPQRAVFINHHPEARHIWLRGQGSVDVMKAAGIPAEQLDITADLIVGAELVVAYRMAHPDTDVIFSSSTLRTEVLIPRLEEEGIEVGIDVKIAQ